jgi:hypothetical protein
MVPKFRDLVLRRIKRNSVNFIVILTAGAIPFLLVAALGGSGSLVIGLGLLALALAQAVDLRIALSHQNGVAERALFFYWMGRCARQSTIVRYQWLVMGAAIGVFQLILQHAYGGMENAFHVVGVMYADVASGEVWRLFIGPFLHYSLDHYVLNFVMLLLLGTLANLLFSHSAVILFILGNAFSAAAQMLLGGELFDNFGGISGGVYALFGAIVSVGIMKSSALPSGLLFLLLSGGAIGIFSGMASLNTATTAHLAGFFLGAIWARVRLIILSRQALVESRD